MSNTNTGGPAFPFTDWHDAPVCSGMTLRDYFAAKAMQALIQHDARDIAWEAYRFADDMLKARDA